MTHTEPAATATVTHEGRQSFVTVTVGGEIVADLRVGRTSHLAFAVAMTDHRLTTPVSVRLEDIAEGTTFSVTAA